jgi:hypothetical protein
VVVADYSFIPECEETQGKKRIQDIEKTSQIPYNKQSSQNKRRKNELNK